MVETRHQPIPAKNDPSDQESDVHLGSFLSALVEPCAAKAQRGHFETSSVAASAIVQFGSVKLARDCAYKSAWGPAPRKNWKRQWCHASIMVKKTGDLLRLRQRRQSHLLRPLDTHQESGRTVTVGVRMLSFCCPLRQLSQSSPYKLLPDLNDSLPSSISKSLSNILNASHSGRLLVSLP